MIPTFVDAALHGEPLLISGDGEQTRDFTFVGTVVNVLAEAVLGRVASPEPVNLAFGTRIPIVDLAQRVADTVGVPVDIRHGPPRPGDVRDSQADSSRLHELFPDVAPVALDEGLQRTVAWFQRTTTWCFASGRMPLEQWINWRRGFDIPISRLIVVDETDRSPAAGS